MSEKEPPHSMTAEEYAKARAVLARIEGLRRGMMASVAAGLLVSFIVYLAVYISSMTIIGPYGNQSNPSSLALLYAAVVFIPFLLIAGYLSYRVDKHVSRLSRGRYEPPPIE